MLNDDFYVKLEKNGKVFYNAISSESEYKDAYDKGVSLKIVSIIRQNQDASNTWISTGIGYTTALTDYVIEHNKESEVVKFQLLEENKKYNVLTGTNFGMTIMGMGASLESNLKQLGAVATPDSIMFYPKDFESKDSIENISKSTT